MLAELLVVPNCAHHEGAAELLRSVLDEAGQRESQVVTRVITSEAEAEHYQFPGSPTLRLDGVDPVPAPDHHVGLTCRLYRRPDGRMSGVPDHDALVQAVRDAAAATSTVVGVTSGTSRFP